MKKTLFTDHFAVIKACIGRLKIPGSIYSVDQIVSMGLFRYDAHKRL